MNTRCAAARPSTCRRLDRCAAIDLKRFILSVSARTAPAALLRIWQRRRAARLAHEIVAAEEMLEQFREAETADLA